MFFDDFYPGSLFVIHSISMATAITSNSSSENLVLRQGSQLKLGFSMDSFDYDKDHIRKITEADRNTFDHVGVRPINSFAPVSPR